jgi:photosystem II stability/assembly factor-like uncharacterized protein
MKKLYILLVALPLVTSSLAQWIPQNSGTTYHLYSVNFTDAVTGYAVGSGGTILKTNDGGTNWTTTTSGTTNWNYSVYCINSNIVYIVGLFPPDRILKTIDGGINWTSSNAPWGLYSVHFPNQDTGYAVGGDKWYYGLEFCLIMKTTDGGLNWNNIFTDSSYKLRSVFFTDSWTGYAVGHYGRILKTTNGGNVWINKFSGDTTISFTSVYFPTTDTGYAVGFPGVVYKTTNGGNDWSSQVSGTSTGLLSVYFPNANIGYAVGYDKTIIKTTNGGTTWSVLDPGNVGDLESVYFINADTGYAVGENGTILKTTNGGGFPVGMNKHLRNLNNLTVFPNPADNIIIINTPIKGYISISNFNGHQLQFKEVTETKTTIDVRELPSGIYLIKLVSEDAIQVGKFVKE